MIPRGAVEDFLNSLTETEAGPEEWPEYERILQLLDDELSIELVEVELGAVWYNPETESYQVHAEAWVEVSHPNVQDLLDVGMRRVHAEVRFPDPGHIRSALLPSGQEAIVYEAEAHEAPVGE